MSLADLIREVLSPESELRVQYLNECIMSARSVKKNKNAPAHTRVEFATQNMTPNDLLYVSGECGRPENRKPKFTCVMLWIPTEQYDELAARDDKETQK